jgi:hypothetical protein
MEVVSRFIKLAALGLTLAVSASASMLQGCGGGGDDSTCCRVCEVGKACGDTCIAMNQTCNTPSGCACNK